MKHQTLIASLSFALMATWSPSVRAHDAACCKPLNADAILKQMSDTLSASKEFSFKATREVSSEVAAEKHLQSKATIEVAVKRPQGMVSHSTSKDDVRSIYADGKTLTIYDAKNNLYAAVPMKSTLDALPAKLSAGYGFVPPLVDFVVSDPYKAIKWRVTSMSYLGEATQSSGFLGLKKTKCHRLALSGKLADAELWIGVADHLPKQLVATFKGAKDSGLKIAFTQWNLSAPPTDTSFTFTAPKDAIAIPMMTADEIKSAWKN
ncbi:hypothetical protein BH11VER1_BH11VER1_34100 [soil metagenome]